MNDRITKEVKAAIHKEIVEVLKKNGMPTTEAVIDGVTFLLKTVSCAHQMRGMKEVK